MNEYETLNSAKQETVLLLGNYRPTLTLARVLSRQGYRIISGLEGCDGGAEYSRFVDQIWDHPSLKPDQGAFAKELRPFIKANKVSIIFPVSEAFVRFFTEHPEACPKDTVVAVADPQLAGKCLDKMFMMQLASANFVPTAPYAMAKSHHDLMKAAETTGFPLVIRPEDSTQRLDGKKALFIKNAGELKRQIPVWPADQCGLILQRKAAGRRHNIYFAARSGQLFRYLHAVILRTDNPDGSGLAIDGITIPQMPELRAYTERLVEALDYSGIGCAQYLVDEETGNVSFLEINARIAGHHALPEYAGLNLSSLLIDQAAGRKFDACNIEGKSNIRYVWTSGEIDAAKIAWLRSEATHSETAFRVFRAIWSAFQADLDMVFTWSDPKPGLMAFKRLLPSWRRLAANFRNRVLHRPSAKTGNSDLKAQS